MSHFRPCDRDTPYLLPPSLDDWLPRDHLARFVADIVDQLDLSALGTYPRRRIEQAIYDSLAFRYLAASQGYLAPFPP